MPKTYAATYLYSQYQEYERKILSFIMNGEEIDKNTEDFDDIRYDVKKRNISNAMLKILDSKNVILMTNSIPLSKAFKVFCAKDIKGPKPDKMKVFIDVSNIITKDPKSGRYVCINNNIDILISYLMSAMHTYIYYVDESRMCNNSKVMKTGARAFALLFTHVVDYVCKISSMASTKNKCMYLTSLYYLTNLLGKDYTSDSCRRIAKDISGLSDREAGIVDIMLSDESFMNIKLFSETLADVLHASKLTIDVIVEKWMTIYGTGTVFALELFPAFASMITDAYIGAYINNQKTIEKVASNTMVEFTKIMISIGVESV